MSRAIPVLAILVAWALAAPAAHARPSYPSNLDQMCRRDGRTPPNPAALAVQASGPGADCALCHNFSSGGFPSGGNVNADGRAFSRGNLDPFCSLAAQNQPPVLAPIGNQTVDVGGTLSLLVTASDADGDPLVLSVAPLPAGATFIETAPGEALFTWVPDLAQSGLNTLRFQASDGLDTDFEDVVVTVGDVNAPPTLAPIGNQRVEVGSTIRIAIGASDPEMGMLAFDFTGLPADATATDFGDGTAEIVWTPASAGSARVTVDVTDDGIPPASDSETFTLRAVDPGATGDVRVRSVEWNDRARKLEIAGVGAMPGQQIDVLDADSGARLGSRRVDDPDGHFHLSIRPFVVPCAVVLSVDGAMGDPLDVAGAPADCGERVLTRAKKAQWKCRKGELRLKLDRGPLDGDVEVRDADTGGLLDASSTDHKGRVQVKLPLSDAPGALAITLAVDGTEWSLDPVPVRGTGRSCSVGGSNGGGGKGKKGRYDDDDDDDDDHGGFGDDDDDDHGGFDDEFDD